MSIDYQQAEHDAFVLRSVIDDLATDWRTPDGHQAIIDNAHLIENALDDLVLLVERIRRASTSRVVDLRKITVSVAAE